MWPKTWMWIAGLLIAAGLGASATPNGSLGSAMAKLVIFSAVTGKVLQDGKPVVGATIDREYLWGWKDETGRDSTQTGPNGEFSFPRIERRSLLASLLPHEPVIRQDLTIRHDGRSYVAWRSSKRDYDDNGELDGRPLRLVCRLEATPGRHPGHSDPGRYFGICEVE